jgi:hypothetical protein
MSKATQPSVVLVTCDEPTDPDHDSKPLVEALSRAGVAAEIWAWDDPSCDWSRPRLSIIRSTWNYVAHLDEFLAWAARVDRLSTLLNPLEVLRWNIHKGYLSRLDAQGFRVVPTELVVRGDLRRSLTAIMADRGWRRAVIKPAVSAASRNTHIIESDSVDEDLFRSLVQSCEMMVQPYVDSVDGYGERSIVWIDGDVTHAIRKTPRFSADEESVSEALPVADDERSLAMSLLGTVPAPLLYGRVDLARDAEGRPMLMELELVEPSLFLPQSPRALERLTHAIVRRLEATGSRL